MKKWHIEFTEQYQPSPMSFWVHMQVNYSGWYGAKQYEPALPKAIPGKGFPVLYVDVFGVELRFSSSEEVEHFLSIIGLKNMPTSLQLSRLRGPNYGPNSHWLSRLPAKLKPWRRRQRIIPMVERALSEFQAVLRYPLHKGQKTIV